MKDSRMTILAENLVNYSCSVKPGENVLIEVNGVDSAMVEELVKAVYKAGGFPFVEINDQRVNRAILNGTSEEHCKRWADYDAYRMQNMDAYIGIRGGNNTFENSDVPSENIKTYSIVYQDKFRHRHIQEFVSKPNPNALLSGCRCQHLHRHCLE